MSTVLSWPITALGYRQLPAKNYRHLALGAGSTGVRGAEGRLGEPSEIARAALFLASDDSGLVIGIELSVDGGTAQI
ncbi:SDR family oxidoreductase [Pseudomonas sp. LT1P18]|uniref:SDR family oxidoreductase n=1 Tax=Pseudomonas arabinosi TaxID=3398357 RepID=UPI0039F10C70